MAYDFAFAAVQLEIDAARKDRGLTEDQRAAAIAALQQKQQREAEAARAKVLDEERQNRRARRKTAKRPTWAAEQRGGTLDH